MPMAIDVPDDEWLGRQLAGMDRGFRVDRLEATLELADGSRAVIEQNLGECREHGIVSRVHHQDRFHPLPLLPGQVSPACRRNPVREIARVLAAALQFGRLHVDSPRSSRTIGRWSAPRP